MPRAGQDVESQMCIGETFITGIASRRFTTNDAVRVQNEHSNTQLSTKTLMMPFREDLTDAVLEFTSCKLCIED